jgi:hypothetical protein
MFPSCCCVAATPGTRIQVYTRKAGTTEDEQLRETLPVGAWCIGPHHGPDRMSPFVPHPTDGTLVAFYVRDGGNEANEARHRRELAERFHWVGDEVVRVVIFLPENLTTSVQGQVHVRQVTAPTG